MLDLDHAALPADPVPMIPAGCQTKPARSDDQAAFLAVLTADRAQDRLPLTGQITNLPLSQPDSSRQEAAVAGQHKTLQPARQRVIGQWYHAGVSEETQAALPR